MKEQNDLTPIVEAYKEYKACKQAIADSLEMLDEESDEELKELAKEELSESKKRVEELEHELKILLLPKDPNDSKNVIVEIRGGAGGDEAALFAAEIYRMYVKYAESRRWKTEMLSLNDTAVCQIGDRAGHLHDPVVGTGGKIEPHHRPFEQLPRHLIQRAELAQHSGVHHGVRMHARHLTETLRLDLPRPNHPLADRGARLRRPHLRNLPDSHRRHLDLQVDAVQQRARNTSHITVHRTRRAGALFGRVVVIPARTGVCLLYTSPSPRDCS